MSHPSQQVFIESVKFVAPALFSDTSVLEVGSLNINGTVRDYFESKEYIGIDLGPGDGVDMILPGENARDHWPDDYFDVSISTECFEHNPHWLGTFWNMYALSRDGVIFTCAGPGRPEHGTISSDIGSSPFTALTDYYRNLDANDFIAEFAADDFKQYLFIENQSDYDLYFFGVKTGSNTEFDSEALIDYFNRNIPGRNLKIIEYNSAVA